ncbi:MAG TPA: hypothetical protein VFY65_12505 [Longimicrobium sp.]|nr:hypothetical protein [Longimicrobium sp.]
MTRTPALVAAAAALGLIAGLALEARASALTREVSPYTVSIALLTPGAPSPAGLEMDGPGAYWDRPAAERRLMKLPPMRARISEERVSGHHRARAHTHQTILARGRGCPREQAERAGQAAPAALDLRRS